MEFCLTVRILFDDAFLCPDDDRAQGPFLKEDVMALKGLEVIPEQKSKLDQPAPEPIVASAPAAQNLPVEKKKMVKPKWLKM